MTGTGGPALSRGVIIYLVAVLLVIVGVGLAVGLAVQAPMWLTVGLTGAASIGYIVGMMWWVRTHVPPENRGIR